MRRSDLRAGPDCLPIERLGETLDAAERAHVEGCVRCEAEVRLWEEFRDSIPVAAEGAAVRWVTAELERRRGAGRARGNGVVSFIRPGVVRWFSFRPALGLAAAAVLAVGLIATIDFDPEPGIDRSVGESQVYRSGGVEVVGPTGDLERAPDALVWTPIAGVDRYDVEILEVDRTPVWHATTGESQVTLPRGVTDRIVPGKPLLWQVTARDRSGQAVASSGPQRFKVRVSASTRSRRP